MRSSHPIGRQTPLLGTMIVTADRIGPVLAALIVALVMVELVGCEREREGDEVLLAYGFAAAASQRLKLDTEATLAIVHGDREKLLKMSWELIVRLDLLETRLDPSESPGTTARWRVTIERREIETSGEDGDGPGGAQGDGGVGASYLGALRRGLARLLQDDPRELTVDQSGNLVAGDRTIFEVLFPLLPHLPVERKARGGTFEGRAHLLLPIVGDVEVEQHGEVARVPEDATRRAGLIDFTLTGYQKGPASSRKGGPALYAIDTVVHDGHDRIRLQAATGLLEARDLSYEADARLRVRLGDGGIPVGPARLRVRLVHKARLLK